MRATRHSQLRVVTAVAARLGFTPKRFARVPWMLMALPIGASTLSHVFERFFARSPVLHCVPSCAGMVTRGDVAPGLARGCGGSGLLSPAPRADHPAAGAGVPHRGLSAVVARRCPAHRLPEPHPHQLR